MTGERNKPEPSKPRDSKRAPEPLPGAHAANRRWQRNVRFNWDNSGRKGGGHGGRR